MDSENDIQPDSESTQARFRNTLKINSNEELVELLGIIYTQGLNEVTRLLIGERSLSFYNSKTSPYVQEIANMFDIDIQGEPEEVVHALLQYPIFAKSFLGTQFGATEVLRPIMNNLEFKTHDNVPDMEPYNFVVRADNTIGLDQKKAASLVNRFACLRDNPAQIILIDIICDKPFTIVEKMFVKQKRLYNIDKEMC